MTRDSRLVAFLATGLALLLVQSTPSVVAHAHAHRSSDPSIWEDEDDDTAASVGLDGYIRGSGLTSVPGSQHVDEWLGLADLDPSGVVLGWLQSGQTQGVGFSSTKIKMYGEGMECNYNLYQITDFGYPPTPDYAFYVYYDGVQVVTLDCSGNPATWYEYAVKVGSLGNPVAMTFDLPFPSLYPSATQEEHYTTTEIPINTDWWGLDSSGGVNVSNALHRWDGTTWALWSGTSFPNTYVAHITDPGATNPFVYVAKSSPTGSAFQVHQ